MTNSIASLERAFAALCAALFILTQTGSAHANIDLAPGKDIIVIGDSLADGLHIGLQQLASDRQIKQRLRKQTKTSSGLAHSSKINWLKTARQIARGKKYGIVIVTLGTNDLVGLRLKGRTIYYNDDRWNAAYAERVKELVGVLRSSGADVYWVGLPITRRNRFQRDYHRLNSVFRTAAVEAGANYVDTWTPLSSQGKYSPYGQNLRGRRALLRTSDGVHFTPAGYKVYANIVLDALNRSWQLLRANPHLNSVSPARAPAPRGDVVLSRSEAAAVKRSSNNKRRQRTKHRKGSVRAFSSGARDIAR